jgi:anti-sigma factor RsiW
MTCRELVELLIDFVSDELPAEHRLRIEQHLRRCPPCEAYLASYQMTIRPTAVPAHSTRAGKTSPGPSSGIAQRPIFLSGLRKSAKLEAMAVWFS